MKNLCLIFLVCCVFGCTTNSELDDLQEMIPEESRVQHELGDGEFGNIVHSMVYNSQPLGGNRYFLSKEEFDDVIFRGNMLLRKYDVLKTFWGSLPRELKFARDKGKFNPSDPRNGKDSYYDPDDCTIYFVSEVTDRILLHEVLHYSQHVYMQSLVYEESYARNLEYEVAIIMDVLEYFSTGRLNYEGSPNGYFPDYLQLIKNLIDSRGDIPEAIKNQLNDCMANWYEYRNLEASEDYEWSYLCHILSLIKK